MTKEQSDLLSLLGQKLFNKPISVSITDEIKAEAQAQAVSTLISSDYKILGKNIRVINAHAELSTLLHDLPFSTFKGYASAYYYSQPIYRPMGDVDFIVSPENYSAAVEKLINAGYTRTGSEHERHEAFRKDKVTFELHSEIKGIPNGADGIATESATAEEKVRALLSDLIQTARIVETQQGKIVIPDDFHHGLIMLLHVAGHMINDGGVGLRHLCDWAVYVNRVDVERFRPQLESIGLWTFACQLTAVCSRYLGLPKQYWAGEWPEEFLDIFINDVLSAGNFGKKEAGRRATLALEHSSFAEVTRERYPAARIAVLLPFFMLANIVRYCILIIKGERKFIKPSTFTGAKKRDELYKEFRLFEV